MKDVDWFWVLIVALCVLPAPLLLVALWVLR
jgi:hypothetical protein